MNMLPTNAAPVRPRRRLVRGSFCLALGLFAAFGLPWEPVQAATQDLPTPEALLTRHIEAIGGAAALRQAQSLTFKGDLSLPFLKAKAPIEFLFQAPDRYYCQFYFHYPFFGFLKVPFVGVREAECGYDGTSGWDVNFDHKVEPLGRDGRAFFRGLLDKFSPLCFRRSFPLTRTLDTRQFAGPRVLPGNDRVRRSAAMPSNSTRSRAACLRAPSIPSTPRTPWSMSRRPTRTSGGWARASDCRSESSFGWATSTTQYKEPSCAPIPRTCRSPVRRSNHRLRRPRC